MFSVSELQNPPRRYEPIYAWVWNGPVTREQTDAQLAEMRRLGINRFYIIPEPKSFRPNTMPTQMEPDYLTPAFFEECRYTFEQAVAQGMDCWLYDEGGWPSGGACGKVLFYHPELARRTLELRELTLPGNTPYTPTDPDTIAAFVNADTQIEPGFTSADDVAVTEYYSERHFFETPGHPDIPDLLLPDTTKVFIEMTHEKYLPYLRHLFGEHISAVFTDEPNSPRPIPMRKEFLAEFEARYGTSIIPVLPAMVGKTEPTEEQAMLIADWFDMCSHFFCDYFMLPQKKWANEHGMAFTGHLSGEDTPGYVRGSSFHSLRALRCMDIPGVDVIWRQIYPGSYAHDKGMPEICVNGFFPRLASSAAAQTGKTDAVTESFGVYGSGLTYDTMRYVTAYQAIRGINIMNAMIMTYDRESLFNTGELPHFNESQPYYRHLSAINDYITRVSWLVSQGDRVCDTALYYPVRDIAVDTASHRPELTVPAAFPYDRMGRALEELQIDFDILDDDVILQAEGIDEGELRMGLARYRRVFIPSDRCMTKAVRDRLARFEAAGGQVLRTLDGVTPPAELGIRAIPGIRVMKRLTETGTLMLVFNENAEPTDVTVSLDGEYVYRIDATEGKLYAASGTVTLTLVSGELAGVYATTDQLPCEQPPVCASELVLPNAFTLRRTSSLVIGEQHEELHLLNEAPVPAALGDWCGLFGLGFSGSAVYETAFARPDGIGERFILDLGEVRHACAVTLNGVSLGARLMPPYRFTVDSALLQAQNTLCVEVVNTSANQHSTTHAFDIWQPWQIPPYVAYQNVFDLDILPSGLYGPVKLVY